MKIIEKIEDQYFIKICPRNFATITSAKIRSKVSTQIQQIEVSQSIYNNVLNVQLIDFEPKEDQKYELYLMENFETIWFGQIMYTTKNVQDYHYGNSDENNLKF